MGLEERLDADLLVALKAGDTTRKLAIRSVKAAITQAKVSGEEAHELSEQEVLAIIVKQIKQRRDSIADFEKGHRQDLIVKEEAEIKVLEEYLPPQMDEVAVRERARIVIAEVGATDMKGMGPVMKRLSGELRGQADSATISRVVRELLS